jgi:predicted peroxiredoxin
MLSRHKAKEQMKHLLEHGVKIKCCYCLSKDNCKTRQWKEKSEALGITTYCTLTPNRPRGWNKHKKTSL